MVRAGFWPAVLWAVGGVCAAQAADKPVYGPPPAWVKPAPTPEPGSPSADDQSAVRLLLQDRQSRIGPDGMEVYSEAVVRVQSPLGLQALGNIAFTWDPE